MDDTTVRQENLTVLGQRGNDQETYYLMFEYYHHASLLNLSASVSRCFRVFLSAKLSIAKDVLSRVTQKPHVKVVIYSLPKHIYPVSKLSKSCLSFSTTKTTIPYKNLRG
jgi:hypothetical protein